MPFDCVGQPLEEGDIVLIPMGNVMFQATVAKVDSGLGSNLVADGGKVAQAQPTVTLVVEIVRPVFPQINRIPDAIKIGSTKPQGAIVA